MSAIILFWTITLALHELLRLVSSEWRTDDIRQVTTLAISECASLAVIEFRLFAGEAAANHYYVKSLSSGHVLSGTLFGPLASFVNVFRDFQVYQIYKKMRMDRSFAAWAFYRVAEVWSASTRFQMNYLHTIYRQVLRVPTQLNGPLL